MRASVAFGVVTVLCLTLTSAAPSARAQASETSPQAAEGP